MEFYTVIDPQKLFDLTRRHADTFTALGKIEKELKKRFAKMDEPILALILAVASGEPLLFKGPPGTAKSWLVRAFCKYIGIDPDLSGATNNSKETDYFEYLLTPFTEPGELFGFFDIAQAQKSGVLVREETGMMQHARVVYLDEVFKGSSAILNSLLSFMNERRFHDRGKRTPVQMQVLFGATNEVPYTSELRAVYDRFTLRCDINNVEANPQDIQVLLNKGWIETYKLHEVPSKSDLLDNLAKFQAEAKATLTTNDNLDFAVADQQFVSALSTRIDVIRKHDLSQMSNRRIIRLLWVMMVHSIYQSVNDEERRKTIEQQKIRFTNKEISLLRFMLDRRDEIAEEHLNFEA